MIFHSYSYDKFTFWNNLTLKIAGRYTEIKKRGGRGKEGEREGERESLS